MTEGRLHPSLVRLLKDQRCVQTLGLLGSDLAGADVVSLLLASMAQRSSDLSTADVMSQYRRDRFVAPAQADPIRLAQLRLQALQYLAPRFEPMEVAPVAPLGSHSVFARVGQNNVVTTTRLTEVAADPTNQLALEAADRRRRLRTSKLQTGDDVLLCAIQRVLRAQVFDGARSFSHFTLLGVVVAGRARAGGEFEIDALTQVLSGFAGFVGQATAHPIRIRLTDFDGSFGQVLTTVAARVGSDTVHCSVDGGREAGRGYYPSVCFKFSVDTGDEVVEVGDGGAVDWASSLLSDRKERLLIAGVSLERLALL